MSKSYWVIGADGQSYGPADEQMLAQWTREGRLVAGSTLQDVSTNQRLPAAQVPAVAAALGPAGGAAGVSGYAPQTVMFERSVGYSPATIVADRPARYPAGAAGSAPAAAGYSPATIVSNQAAGAGPAGYSPRTIVADLPAGGGPQRPGVPQPGQAGYAPQTVMFQQPAGYQQQAQTAAAVPAAQRRRPASHSRPAGGPAADGYAGDSPRTVMFEQLPAGYPAPAAHPGAGAPQPQQPGAAAAPGYQAPLGYAGPYGGYTAAGHGLNSFSVVGAVFLHWVTFGLFSVVYHQMKHGALPRVRADDPSAGKAVGFMFIPFFGLWYWNFFANLRLCDRINEQRRVAGLPDGAPRGMALAYAICMAIPYFNVLIGFPIMGAIYHGMLQGSVNELVRATRGPNA